MRAHTADGVRPLAHSLEAEQSIIGAILLSNKAFARVSDFLDASHFHFPANKLIFDICSNLIRAGKLADPITVGACLPPDFSAAGMNADQYFRQLVGEATTSLNAPEYGKIIRDLALKRQVDEMLQIALHETQNPRSMIPPDQQIDDLYSRVGALRRARQDGITTVCASDLIAKPAPKRRYVIEDFVPDRTVANMSGDGGTGKSLIALQAAVAVTSGTPWLGLQTERGPVLYLSAEDELDEVHRRMEDVVRDACVDAADIRELHFFPLAGRDAILASFDQAGLIKTRPLWDRLRAVVEQIGPKLVIIDTLADAFGGNEIDRGQVRSFVQLLRGLAIESNLAVLTLSHPSLTGMASKTGTSGSTAWSNSVRARSYLERPKSDDDADADPNVRLLTVKKANYGQIGKEIRVRWQDGVFRRDDDALLHRPATSQRAEQKFLDLLRLMTEQGRDVSDKASSGFAPSLFEQHPNAEGIRKSAFKRAMESLLARGEIKVEEYGPPSRRRSRIVKAG